MPWINLSEKEIRVCLYALSKIDALDIPDSIINNQENKKLRKKIERKLIPIKISSRKSKGRNLQKWICKKISELINIPYDQKNDQCLIHSREMGQQGLDVILREEALKEFPFSIESKNSESFNIKKVIEQVEFNQMDDTDWMIVYKRKSFKNPIVIIDWYCFEKIWNRIKDKDNEIR